MQPRTLTGRAGARLVLTCEHASAEVPPEYADLGLPRAHLTDHIGWDIGAAALTEALSGTLAAPAVLSAASRLLVDCNRDLTDLDLIPPESHGVPIPRNVDVDAVERGRRLERFYDPFHTSIDATLADHDTAMLLSVHSFTPSLNGRDRPFDIGVLFDDFIDLADLLADRLAAAGFRVRMNEPYSGLAGLIFSARAHGRRHRRPYLELEINNALLRSDAACSAMAARLGDAVAEVAERARPPQPDQR